MQPYRNNGTLLCNLKPHDNNIFPCIRQAKQYLYMPYNVQVLTYVEQFIAANCTKHDTKKKDDART